MTISDLVTSVMVYAVAIIGIIVMRKIQPENKTYPIFATCVCIAFTIGKCIRILK